MDRFQCFYAYPVYAFSVIVLFMCFCANAQDYDFVVSIGETNRIDEAFVESLGNKNLVKKGDGVLWSSPAMSNYTGKIIVEEGALIVSTSKDLGTKAQGTIIRNSASLIIYTGSGVAGSAAADDLRLEDHITVEGFGSLDHGAAVYVPDNGDRPQRSMFRGGMSLSGDAKIYSGQPIGFYGNEILMKGCNLTIDASEDGAVVLNNTVIVPNASEVGNIDVIGGKLIFSGNSKTVLVGDANKTLTIADGAILRLENTTLQPVWKLVVEEGASFFASGKTTGDAYNHYAGVVEWNTSDGEDLVLNEGVSLTFDQLVSGKGAMTASRGKITFKGDCRLSGGLNFSNTIFSMDTDDLVWGLGGLMIGHRNDAYVGESDKSDGLTHWQYCEQGPGPLLEQDLFWKASKTSDESWRCEGYLWNRSDTEQTFWISCRSDYRTALYIDADGDGEIDFKPGQMTNAKKKYSVSLTPGPHLFRIATYANTGTIGGPATNARKLRFDVSGGTTEQDNWTLMRDSGNGYLFTTNSATPVEARAASPNAISKLKMSGFASLNMHGRPLEIAHMEGVASFSSDGNLPVTILEKWTVAPKDIESGDVLRYDGPICFKSNATIELLGLETLPINMKSTVLCEAASISGLETCKMVDLRGRRWNLSVESGRQIVLSQIPLGLIVRIR
jgi:hypothetical protein